VIEPAVRSTPARAPQTPARSLIFSIVFSVVYPLCFYFNWFLFAYYPQANEFHLSDQLVETSGPPIVWYGWMAASAVVSLAAAFVIPRAVAARVPPIIAWLIPFAAIVAILIYEKRWFL
jgi:hypothetical protein